MTILNRPSDGLPSILVATFKYLLFTSKAPRGKILDELAPPSLVKDPGLAKFTLNTWEQLGLLVRTGEDTISLSQDLVNTRVARKDPVTALRKIVLKLVLSTENRPSISDDQNAKSNDFVRALSWAMLQNPFKFPKNYDEVQSLEQEQFKDSTNRRALQNDTRWQGFKAWAQFLGFGWIDIAGNLIPDPSGAIMMVSDELLEGRAQLPVGSWMENLCHVIPVLDGGEFQKAILDEMDVENLDMPSPVEASRVLSIAIRSLKLSGVIDLDDKADSPQFTYLTNPMAKQDIRVSHVMRGAKKS